jgi:hypothetical protein
MAAAQNPLLLGGEMSMWTDNYCNVRQCGAYSGDPPVGSKLFPPEQDAAFQRSVGGMIWPRGFVAAASYWNWDNKTDPASPAFVQSIWKLNDALQARNLSTCPTNCSCDEVSACGKPYIPLHLPGSKIVMVDCGTASRNRWNVTASTKSGGRSMQVQLAGNPPGPKPTTPLCWGYAQQEDKDCQGCLELVDCKTAPFFTHLRNGNLVDSVTGNCVDLSAIGKPPIGLLGAWSCGQNGQPNQRFAVDAISGMIVSTATDYTVDSGYAGMCATVKI